MDIKRTVLWVIFFMSAVMLFDNWQRDHGRPSMFFPSATPTKTAGSAAPGTTTPGTQPADLPATNAAAPANTPAATQSQLVKFSTDVYSGEIDTRGGTLSKLSLVKQGDGKQPDLVITLFDRTGNHTYLARTGLLGGDFPNHNDIYTLMPNQQHRAEGRRQIVQLELRVAGQGRPEGHQDLHVHARQLCDRRRHEDPERRHRAGQPVGVYGTGARRPAGGNAALLAHVHRPGCLHRTESLPEDDVRRHRQEQGRLRKQADNGWIAMVQHYFASAWIPQQGVKRDIYVEKIDPPLYRVGVKQPVAAIAPGQTVDVSARLFAGPEEERMLEGIAPGLELVKDYGWVTIIAKPLFWLLEKIHSYVGNWGWAIVLLTLLIKAVFFPLSAASYKSMARMKAITPRMQALRERFKGDPQKMNAALMELYKTEKVNPFGGCLPVVVQIPVFISLYWVLLSSVEMRGAPWILWIHDLSQQDPYFILPVLMAVSMFLQTKLNPTPPDPVQAKMMMFMPIAFSVMFFFFPAGLVLYYVVNNVLSIAQQYYITRMMGQSKAKPA